MKIAIGQLSAQTDKTANLQSITKLVDQAIQHGVELVVFPEYALYKQPVMDEKFVAAAEPLDGPFVRTVRELAAGSDVNIVVGMNEAIPDADKAYNSLVLLGRDGEINGIYRKLHLYDAFGGAESRWIRPGDHGQQLVHSIGDLKFGMMTCYDLRFPEMARKLVDDGADVILLPTAWTPGPRKEDHWATMVRARAIENTSYVVGAGQAPPLATGGSMIVDPMGIVVAELGETIGIIVADIDLERVRSVRRNNPSLTHRRFDTVERH